MRKFCDIKTAEHELYFLKNIKNILIFKLKKKPQFNDLLNGLRDIFLLEHRRKAGG